MHLYIFLLALVTNSLIINAMDKIKLDSVDDLPALIKLLEQLDKQPRFSGKGVKHKKSKVLEYENSDICRILKILNGNAQIETKNAWFIDTICHPLEINRRKYIYTGLVLCLYDFQQRCSVSVLKNEFTKVVVKLKSNWQAKNIKEYPNLMTKQNENGWCFFIKPASETIRGEDVLMRCLLNEFKLSEKVICDNMWLSSKTDVGPKIYRGDIYLHICNNALREFDNHFKFGLIQKLATAEIELAKKIIVFKEI